MKSVSFFWTVPKIWCVKNVQLFGPPCTFLTTRRYASAVYAIVVCLSVDLSVRLSQAATWFLAWRHPSTYHTGIWVSPIIKVLPSWTLSQTLDLENFATEVDCVVNNEQNSSTVEVVEDIYDGVVVYYTSVNCNPLTLLVRFNLMCICCKQGWPKKMYIFQDMISLELLKRKWNEFRQNVPRVSGNKG